MERGMDAKTISALLGHASTSFTLDTYTHVLDMQRREGMALMDDMFAVQNTCPYPVVVSAVSNGYLLNAVAFNGISVLAQDVMQGIAEIKERIIEKYDGMMLPPATPADLLVLQPNEMYFLIQL